MKKMINSRLTVFVSCLFVLSFLLAPSPAKTAKTQGGTTPGFVGADNGKAFIYDESTGTSLPLKTSMPVFKAFGVSTSGQSLLYSPLKNRIPSGELFLEELATGTATKITGDLILEAAFSPDESKIAYTFATGTNFGLALINVDSEQKENLISENVLPDFLQWDLSGEAIYYFEITDGLSATGIMPHGVSVRNKQIRGPLENAFPDDFPKFSPEVNGIAPKLPNASQESNAEINYPFEVVSPDGANRICGTDLFGNGDIGLCQYGASRAAVEEFQLARGRLLKVLNKGVIVRSFEDDRTTTDFVSWDGKKSRLAASAQVSYNLPLSSFILTQGGSGYPSTSACTSGHTGSLAFAYDMQNQTVGKHVLASAEGLVVNTFNTVNCNSLDTNGCLDYDVNCAPNNNNGGWGNTVIIQHSDTTYSRYAHLQFNSVRVASNASACQGLYLGNQGHTGNTVGNLNGCGDHLHFQKQAAVMGASISVSFSETSNPLACSASYTSGSSETSTCSTCPLTSITPTIVSPGTGTEPGQIISNTTPTLTWNAVTGATNYDVFISIYPYGSSNLVYEQSCVSGLSHPVPPGYLINGNKYRWNIQANVSCGSCVSQYSSPLYFQTATACNAPGAFSLSAPSDGQSFSATTTSVLLSWGISANADSYDVYLGTSSNPPFLANQTGTSRSVPVTAGQTYWWKVVARVNCNSSLTSTTPIRSFSVQQTCNAPGAFSLSSPSDGQSFSSTTTSVPLSWGISANADSYDFYFGTSSNPPFLANQTGTSRSVPVAAGQTYWWKVVARVNCNSSLTSTTAIRSFSVQQTCNAPGAFSLSSPSDGQSFSATTTSVPLSWGISANADSYDFYFGTSSNPPFLANQTGTSRSVPVTAGQTYWWKVVARVNCNSSLTSTTAIRSFSAQQTCNAPGAFSLGSPSDGQSFSSTTTSVPLSWGISANADSYDVYLGTSSNPPFLANQTGTSRSVPVTAGQTYWWKVVARVNCNSSLTSTTPIRSFSVQQTCNAPGAFSLSFPNNGQTLSSTSSVALSWGTSANADSYDVYFGTSSNPPFFANQAGTSRSVSVASGPTYFWKVVARVNCDSSLTAMAGIWSFSVQPSCNAPGAFSLSFPSNGQTLSSTSSVTLSWGTSANANSYDVYFGTSSNPPFLANQTGTSRSVNVTAGQTYFWKVVARVTCDSSLTATAGTWSFSVQASCNSPGAFSLSFPSNGQTLSSTSSVTLSWGTSASANSYDVYFGTSSNPPFFANQTSTNRPVSVASGQTYFWKVVARANCDSSLTATAGTWSFSVQASCNSPGAFSLSFPSNGQNLSSTSSVTLSWGTSASANSYDVYFGTSSNPPFFANQAGTSFSVSVTPGQSYFWKVVARVNCNASMTFTAGVWSFSVQTETSGPRVVSATISGKHLMIFGQNFSPRAVIYMNGERKKTIYDDQNPTGVMTGVMIGKKVGKQIASGETVMLQVFNADGSASNRFSFTRPAGSGLQVSVDRNPVLPSSSPCGSSPPTWDFVVTVSATGDTGVTISSFRWDYYDGDGDYLGIQTDTGDTFANWFNACGIGNRRIPAGGRACGPVCVSLGGRNSGSVILTFYGTDDQSQAVVISSARILLQGSSLLTTEEQSDRQYLKPQGTKRERL